MRKSLGLFIFLLLNLLVVSAQFKEADFEHYTVLNGLSDNNVYCIEQDQVGYMWIGTEMGLNCFNGEAFKHYFSRSKPLYLAASNILKLIPFSKNRLGVVSRLGFQVIDTKNLSTENYRFPDTSFFSNYNNGIFDALELPDQSILLSSTTGIYVFDKPGHPDFRYDHYTSGDPENKRILYGRDIVKIDKNEAIIYTSGYKMDHYDFQKKMLSHIQPSSSEWKIFYPDHLHGSNCERIGENQFIIFNPYSDSITFYDRSRNMRVTSRPACMKLGELNWASREFMLNDSSFAMNCRTTGYYLFALNRKTGIISSDNVKYLSSYKCNVLFTDKENCLWVGTRTGLLRQKGKSLFVQSTIQLNEHSPDVNENLSCVYRYKNKLYLGSENRNEGLLVVDTATMQVINKIKFYGGNNGWSEIGSIQSYHKDTLWIGTSKGLLWMDVNTNWYGYVLDKRGDSVLAGGGPELEPVDKNGKAWLFDFMNGKAGFYDTSERTFTFFTPHTTPSLPFGRIKHIVYDAYGDVWIAGHGLARWNNGKQQFDTMMNVYAGPNKFKDDILAITSDKKGSLWLYNAENVLLEYQIKEKKFYQHGAEEGLPLFVQSMAESVEDKLWFTTGSQLICYNLLTGSVIYFDQRDGLPIERASNRKLFFDRERNCYYSLHNNYLASFPANIPQMNEKSKCLLISELALADTIFYNPTGMLALDYTQQNFSIHFAVLNYDEPAAYNFFYCVDNKSWINLDGQKVIFFNQLSPGKRHIQIKAVSKLGQQLTTSIFLNISSPLWQRWWFILLSFLVAGVMLYLAYSYRINQIMKVQAIRNNIARDLHDDIASTIGSINVYSEVAFDKIQKQQPVIAEEILQKIGSTSRIMIDRMSDIVWSINSTNDYLSNLVDRMKNFCSMTLSPRSIEFNFLVNERFSGIPLTMDKRKNIFLIFKECIHNILKYADCDQVDITITAQQNHIIMTIKDNGRGFNVKDYAPYNGNGLKNMKQRAESMRGEMHIFSAINQGTTISLKVRI